MDKTRNSETGNGYGSIAHVTLLQSMHRGMRGRLVRILCLSALALTAASPLLAQAASKALAVSVTVKANTIMQVEYQAQQLVVTPADVARGYCDARAASRVRVSSNSRAGYLISVFSRLPIFKSVRVDMPDASAQLGPEGGSISQLGRRGKALLHQLTYRFQLAEGVTPGSYPWPLALGVRAI